jgi:hypothetical protein
LTVEIFGASYRINKITQLATGVDPNDSSISDFTKARIRLPMNKGGLGIRDLETRAASEYIGGAVSGISQLLDRRDKDGLMIRGRMTSERLIDWLGESGAVSGAMLMGSNKFCNQAMVWLRRFGVIYIHFYHTMSRAVQDTIGTYFHLRYGNKLELKCETRCPNVASTCSVNL